MDEGEDLLFNDLGDVLGGEEGNKGVHEPLERHLVVKGEGALLHGIVQQVQSQQLHFLILDAKSLLDGLDSLRGEVGPGVDHVHHSLVLRARGLLQLLRSSTLDLAFKHAHISNLIILFG